MRKKIEVRPIKDREIVNSSNHYSLIGINTLRKLSESLSDFIMSDDGEEQAYLYVTGTQLRYVRKWFDSHGINAQYNILELLK